MQGFFMLRGDMYYFLNPDTKCVYILYEVTMYGIVNLFAMATQSPYACQRYVPLEIEVSISNCEQEAGGTY